MSDEEEDSMSEGFSASEDEWKPSKDMRGGESSDDDDSDFEGTVVGGSGVGTATASAHGGNKKKEPKARSATKQTAIKKRKPSGQSLRTKLYNKYRPPPKTINSPPGAGNNSPASTSRTASKNSRKPNESSEQHGDSSSDSSVDDYLVNPAELDLQSSFFNSSGNKSLDKQPSPTPVFDCNAGIANLSDSGSEDNNISSGDEGEESKAFDFRNLLEKANSLERAKETIAKRANATSKKQQSANEARTTAIDVTSLLALGEKQGCPNDADDKAKDGSKRLSKTKSTRVKRHTKTRPTSTVAAGDSDDSDWEEVADGDSSARSDQGDESLRNHDSSHVENLEIHVDLVTRKRTKEEKTKEELEMQLKRRLNHEIRKRQLSFHKVSLLCLFARSYRYNRLLNDTALMEAVVNLLPTKNAYPSERGTDIKYYQSLITWYKTAIKLHSLNLYPDKTPRKKFLKQELMQQIQRKQARCKQDMIFILVILLRGMGLQCRLVVNLQPMKLKPDSANLLKIKVKHGDDHNDDKEPKKNVKTDEEHPTSSTKAAKNSCQNKNQSSEKESSCKHEKKGSTSKSRKPSKTKETVQDSIEPEPNVEQSIKVEKDKLLVLSDQNSSTNTRNGFPEITSDHIGLVKQEDAIVAVDIVTKRNTRGNKSRNIEMQAMDEANNQIQVKSVLDKLAGYQNTEAQSVASVGNAIKAPADGAVETKAVNKYAKRVHNEESNDIKTPKLKKPSLSRLKSQPKESEEDEEIQAKDIPGRAQVHQTDGNTASSVSKRTRLRTTTANKENTNATSTNTAASTKIPNKTNKQKSTLSVPKIVVQNAPEADSDAVTPTARRRSRSVSPKVYVSPQFLQSKSYKAKFSPQPNKITAGRASRKLQIKELVQENPTTSTSSSVRILRSRQKSSELALPQLDGADDKIKQKVSASSKRPQLQKLQKSRSKEDSDEDFQPSPPKKPKQAPVLPKKVTQLQKDRRVLSTDDEASCSKDQKIKTNADMWVEVWSDLEEQWICVDVFKGKLHCVESIRKSASSSLSYVFAFQNDLSIKDVTARYCANWSTTLRRERVEKSWLDRAISGLLGRRTKRDTREDQELRRIHEEKPLPKTITEFKDHPLYVLKRHLLKFQAIYPPNAPTLGFIRGEPIYSRDCVHTLHSRDIWLKQARTVKLGEQPYKIVKARPKWDRLTQSVIKDQPLEIFGYWQTEDYDPPTAENGIVPRNAYGNVELFKARMLPKKTVHIRLSGLNRICKKLGIDCANAVVGFDFHQGACHPLYDGFVVCEEFAEIVQNAWQEDQENQERKEQEKYEARVYGNWKKLIRGLLIRERLKKKYNF